MTAPAMEPFYRAAAIESGPSRATLEWMLVFALLVSHATLFTWYTGQIWEDFFITFQFSRNLVEGAGLTYNPGERVHGFTSPLGTLLPALLYWATGSSSFEPALAAYRVTSILAMAAGVTFLFRLLRNELGRGTAWLFLLIFLFDSKSAAFTTNGMETGWMLLFVALAFCRSVRTSPGGWLATGLLWGGLLWTRPDGCVYIAIFALIQWIWQEGTAVVRGLNIARQALVTTAVYLPWFAFAWWYFGSPIPQTVRAKSSFSDKLQNLWNLPLEFLPYQAADVFSPMYAALVDADWPAGLRALHIAMFAVAGLYWLMPFAERIGRAASLASFLLFLYIIVIPSFPWYFPPLTLMASVALAALLARPFTLRAQPGFLLLATMTIAVILSVAAYVDVHVFRLCRIQQQVIEWGNRKPIGDWLRQHARPTDTVYLECLGYIGYFSGCRMVDFPGLISPFVVDTRKRREELGSNQHDYCFAFEQLQPEWLVARRPEYENVDQDVPGFAARYELVAIFDVTATLAEDLPFYGSDWPFHDAHFGVFRRRDLAQRESSDP